MFDIIDVVPEIDNPQTNHKFKTLLANEEKGPISALNSCKGFLVAAVGAKVIAYEYEDDKLIGVAFLDTSFYITEIKVVKGLIALFDIIKSVWFLAFQVCNYLIIEVLKNRRIHQNSNYWVKTTLNYQHLLVIFL